MVTGLLPKKNHHHPFLLIQGTWGWVITVGRGIPCLEKEATNSTGYWMRIEGHFPALRVFSVISLGLLPLPRNECTTTGLQLSVFQGKQCHFQQLFTKEDSRLSHKPTKNKSLQHKGG